MAPRHALRESLGELRTQLAASTSLSMEERRRLEQLIADLAARADGEGAEDEPQSLADRLHDAREQFEEDHPNLTLAIGAVADALSRLGI